jgi:hypothetical protein
MGAARPSLIQSLIAEEIRRIVDDAKSDGGVLSTSAATAQILKAYGDSTLTERDLADRIITAAAASGLAVEIDSAGPKAGAPPGEGEAAIEAG